MEGAAHPATVLKETPTTQQRHKGGDREGAWGSKVPVRLHPGLPPGKEGLLACPHFYVHTSGEKSSKVPITSLLCKVASLCCLEHVAAMCLGANRDEEHR